MTLPGNETCPSSPAGTPNRWRQVVPSDWPLNPAVPGLEKFAGPTKTRRFKRTAYELQFLALSLNGWGRGSAFPIWAEPV